MGIIDLNADVGESFGNMTSGLDNEIVPFSIQLKKSNVIFKKDEHPREGISMEALQ